MRDSKIIRISGTVRLRFGKYVLIRFVVIRIVFGARDSECRLLDPPQNPSAGIQTLPVHHPLNKPPSRIHEQVNETNAGPFCAMMKTCVVEALSSTY